MAHRAIREERQKITEAKHFRLLCPHCNSSVHVEWTFPYTAVRRQQAIHLAIEEHRRLCSGAPPEASRVYRIEYPRA